MKFYYKYWLLLFLFIIVCELNSIAQFNNKLIYDKWYIEKMFDPVYNYITDGKYVEGYYWEFSKGFFYDDVLKTNMTKPIIFKAYFKIKNNIITADVKPDGWVKFAEIMELEKNKFILKLFKPNGKTEVILHLIK